MRNRRSVSVAWIRRRGKLSDQPGLYSIVAEHPTDGWTPEDRAVNRRLKAEDRALRFYGSDRALRHRRPASLGGPTS